MRIRKLRVKNSIGLTDGLGANEVIVEINTDNKIIMVLGKNGSGKSSLLKQMNPVFQKELFIDGLEAEKDVDIEDQGFLFKIRHKMTPAGKVSSIMYKFDAEGKTLLETINSNGGVRTFNESVQQHLGFTMDYFNIGFASSDISGFIEAPASERKKFVSKFIPSLTPYSNGYKVASKYLASLRKDIETLRNSLGEFDQIEHKKSKLSSVTNQIEHIKQEITDKQNIINGLKHSIVFILKQYNLKQPSELSTHLSAVETKGALLENEIFAQEAAINCTDSLTILNTKVHELSTKISNTEIEQKYAATELNSLNGLNEANNKDISRYNVENTRMTELLNKTSDLQAQIDELNTKLTETTSIRDTIADQISNLIGSKTDDEYRALLNSQKEYNLLIQQFMEFVSKQKMNIVDAVLTNTKPLNTYKKELIETNEGMMNKRNELIQNNKVLQVGLDRYNAIATKRPDSCIDDGCAFIKDVISGRGNQVLIDSNLLQIEELHHKIEDYSIEIDIVTQMIDFIVAISDFMTKFKTFRDSDTSFHIIPDYNGNIKKFITDIFKNQIELPPIIISNYNELKNKHSKLNSELSEINVQLHSINDALINIEKYKTTIELNNASIEEINQKIESNEVLITATKVKQFELASLLAESVKNRNELRLIIDQIETLDKLRADLKTNLELQTKIAAHLDEVKQTVDKVQVLQGELNTPANELAELEKQKSELDEYFYGFNFTTKKLETAEADFNQMSKLVNALHPTNGIPLLFINEIMIKPKKFTNELLNLAYNGTFNIDFKITDSEFSIPIYKNNGNTAADILQVSSGQRAMTKAALCMSLVSAFIGKYNILNLDELDAFLDDDNRRYFLYILLMQIQHLKLEQVFIISHNNEFFSCEENLGLILFNGHIAPINDPGFNSRSTIIADLSTYKLRKKNA